MDVLRSLLEFAVCAAVIVVAGTVLTKCADTIAELTKLGRLLVGSVLLAGATSLPELTVDISAILATQTAIMGQLYYVEGRSKFIDPDAWLVIAIVMGGLALVYYTQ